MNWSPYVLETRTLFWFEHGCSGHRMFWEHARYDDLDMGALVTVGKTRHHNPEALQMGVRFIKPLATTITATITIIVITTTTTTTTSRSPPYQLCSLHVALNMSGAGCQEPKWKRTWFTQNHQKCWHARSSNGRH